jgi:predicted RNA-binding protein YlxR (DUF448 family)
MTTKHVPIRTCIATGEKKPKFELLRIVQRSLDGKIVIDPKGKEKGRGANISMYPEALEIAFKKKAIERAFKLRSPLSEEEKTRLTAEFGQALHDREFRKGNQRVTIKISKLDLQKLD